MAGKLAADDIKRPACIMEYLDTHELLKNCLCLYEQGHSLGMAYTLT